MSNFERLQFTVKKIFRDSGINEENSQILEQMMLFISGAPVIANKLDLPFSKGSNDSFFYMSFSNLTPEEKISIMNLIERREVPVSINENGSKTTYAIVTERFINNFLPLVQKMLPQFKVRCAHVLEVDREISKDTPEAYEEAIFKTINNILLECDNNICTHIANYFDWMLGTLGFSSKETLYTTVRSIQEMFDQATTNEAIATDCKRLSQFIDSHPKESYNENVENLMKVLSNYQSRFFSTKNHQEEGNINGMSIAMTNGK